MNFSTVLAATVPVYIVMLVGALARRLGALPQAADKGVMHLAVRVLFPCLAFERIVGNPALDDWRQVLLAAALGYVLVAAAILLCFAITPLIGLKRGAGARTFGLCTGLQNYGFVAIPVVESLFPNGKQLVGVLFTLSLGIEIAMWTVGVGLLTGLSKAPWRHALNPPVFSILSSLALHFAGAGPHVPAMVHTVAATLGNCAIPLSLLLIGATIMDCLGVERINWAVAIASPILRQFILPFGFLFAGLWLHANDDLKRILCVQAAMPSAVFTIVVARHYGGHAPTAMQIIIATTIVSLFTAPWMIGFALRFFGL